LENRKPCIADLVLCVEHVLLPLNLSLSLAKDEIRRRIIDAAYESFWRSGFGIEVDDALAIAEQVDV
jgi:hypothetical protein